MAYVWPEKNWKFSLEDYRTLSGAIWWWLMSAAGRVYSCFSAANLLDRRSQIKSIWFLLKKIFSFYVRSKKLNSTICLLRTCFLPKQWTCKIMWSLFLCICRWFSVMQVKLAYIFSNYKFLHQILTFASELLFYFIPDFKYYKVCENIRVSWP